MDARVTYLGLPLAHPLFPGASPLADDLDAVRRLEDAGASALVMYSLFEEQLSAESRAAQRHFDLHGEANAEATSYFPSTPVFTRGPDAYLEQLRRIRASVAVPVIASLNGSTPGGWLAYARLLQEAGAHALELNLYNLPTDPEVDGGTVEDRALEVVREVRRATTLPLGVKLSPFWSSLPHFAQSLARAGADGLVLFNRFYQPDIDPETLDVVRTLKLSTSDELLPRLRWLAIVSAHSSLSLAASGGVHTALDAVKAVLAGAHGVQVVSALLRHGPAHLAALIAGFRSWFEEHGYESVASAVGSMNLARCPDGAAYERASYIQILQGWHT